MTNPNNFYIPSLDELPHLRDPVNIFSSISTSIILPNFNNQFEQVSPYKNSRLSVQTIRYSYYNNIFLQLWTRGNLARIDLMNNYYSNFIPGGNDTFLANLFNRLLMAPGTKWGGVPVNFIGFVFTLNEFAALFGWSLLAPPNKYLPESGIFPELNQTYGDLVGATVPDQFVKDVLASLTESDRQRRESCLSAFVINLIQGQITENTASNYFKFYFSQQLAYYISDDFTNLLPTLNIPAPAIQIISGHIANLISLLQTILSYLVGGNITFSSTSSSNSNSNTNKQLPAILAISSNVSNKFKTNSVESDDYQGLTKEQAIAKYKEKYNLE